MSVRRNTTNRLTLFRTCAVCGQTMITTADTPFVRQVRDGGTQKTCYYCSERCKRESYIYNYDGFAWKRRQEKESAKDVTEKNKRYYQANSDALRELRRKRYHAMSDDEKSRENAYRRAKHAINREEDNAKRRAYRARKKEERCAIEICNIQT